VTLCGCFGGEAGTVLVPLIEQEGVSVRGTRTQTPNAVVVDDRRSGERQRLFETPATALPRHELDDLYGATLVEGLTATACVLGGPPQPDTIPPKTYRRLAVDLRRGNGGQRAVGTGQSAKTARV
jgi:1-phosphofructokinase